MINAVIGCVCATHAWGGPEAVHEGRKKECDYDYHSDDRGMNE